jgi:hypothetical protein
LSIRPGEEERRRGDSFVAAVGDVEGGEHLETIFLKSYEKEIIKLINYFKTNFSSDLLSRFTYDYCILIK